MRRRRGGVVRTVGRTAAVAGTATAVSGRVQRRQAKRYAAEDQQAAAYQQAAYDDGVADARAAEAAARAAPQPSASGGSDKIAELERLGKLKSDGLLTDEEFAAAKADLLGL